MQRRNCHQLLQKSIHITGICFGSILVIVQRILNNFLIFFSSKKKIGKHVPDGGVASIQWTDQLNRATTWWKHRYHPTYWSSIKNNRFGKRVHVSIFLSIFTGIAQENLLQVLQILLKAKLLTCSDDESSLTGASVIELFLAYKK